MTFAPLDWVVAALFLGALAALATSARLRESSAFQFLTAGRKLTLPAFVATLVSTWYGGVLGIGESVSYFGVGTWLLLGIPYYAFALLYAFVLAPRVRGAKEYTLPERLETTFGRPAAYVGALLVFALAVPAAHLLMLGTLVQQVTGWTLGACIAIGAVVGGAFLAKGGLLADVRVGMLAFLGMYAGFGAIALHSAAQMPLAEAVAALPDPALRTFTGGSDWTVVLSFFILGAWTLVDPGFHQRVASAESPETGRKGVLVSVGFWILFDVLSITTALYALARLDSVPQNLVAIYPAYAEQALPPGLKALFFCGMLGTVLSALVGYALVAAGTLGREIAGRQARDLESPRVVAWTRWGLVASLAAAAWLALGLESVVALWYAWSGCVIGALLLPVGLSYLREPRDEGPSLAAAIAMAGGFLVSFAWLLHGRRTNNPDLAVAWIRDGGIGRLAVPPLTEEAKTHAVVFGVGTLLPALLTTCLLYAIARRIERRRT